MNTNLGKSWQVGRPTECWLSIRTVGNNSVILPACRMRTRSVLSNATSRLIYILKKFNSRTVTKCKDYLTAEQECISGQSCRLRLWNPDKIRTTTIFVEYVCYRYTVNGYRVSWRRHRSVERNSSFCHFYVVSYLASTIICINHATAAPASVWTMHRPLLEVEQFDGRYVFAVAADGDGVYFSLTFWTVWRSFAWCIIRPCIQYAAGASIVWERILCYL